MTPKNGSPARLYARSPLHFKRGAYVRFQPHLGAASSSQAHYFVIELVGK